MLLALARRRFYRNFSFSPSDKPGFLFIENVEKLRSMVVDSVQPVNSPSSYEIPDDLKKLFKPTQTQKKKFSLVFNSKSLSASSLNQSPPYPTQDRLDILNILNIQQPSSILPLTPSEQQLFLQELSESVNNTGNNEDNFVECANVLKKRRRRMRGHKHKKRLKERRHKADK